MAVVFNVGVVMKFLGFGLLALACLAGPAKADLLTLNFVGSVYTCTAPCTDTSPAPVSITFDTSVAGTMGTNPQAVYFNNVADVTIGSFNFSNPNSTTTIYNNFNNNAYIFDSIDVEFNQSGFSGSLGIYEFSSSPNPTLLTSASFSTPIDLSQLSDWYAQLSTPNGSVFEHIEANVQAIPETQTWAMLLIGFVVIGLSKARRMTIARLD